MVQPEQSVFGLVLSNMLNLVHELLGHYKGVRFQMKHNAGKL